MEWIRRQDVELLVLLLIISLAVGVAGYYYIAKLSLVNSILNASMLMGGMGQAEPVITTGGKYFSAVYAIYCGAFFLIIFALIVNRIFAHHGTKEKNE